MIDRNYGDPHRRRYRDYSQAKADRCRKVSCLLRFTPSRDNTQNDNTHNTHLPLAVNGSLTSVLSPTLWSTFSGRPAFTYFFIIFLCVIFALWCFSLLHRQTTKIDQPFVQSIETRTGNQYQNDAMPFIAALQTLYIIL